MKIIKKNDKIVALVFDGEFEYGTNPLTDEQLPLQVISLKHPKGKIFAAHIHKPVKRITDYLLEALMVISGRVKVDLYHGKELVETLILTGGQGIMVIDGVIKLEVLEDTKMMEFKNGPFVEDKEVLENFNF